MRAPEHPERARRAAPALPALLALVDAVVDAAVDATLTRRAPHAAGAVQSPLRALCDEARRQSMSVERLLVVLKQRWWQHARVLASSRVESGEQVARLVTLCIREFYDERRVSGPASGRELGVPSTVRGDAQSSRQGAS